MQQAKRENNMVAVYLYNDEINGLFVVAPEKGTDKPDYCADRYKIYKESQKEYRWDKPIEQQKAEEQGRAKRTLATIAFYKKIAKSINLINSIPKYTTKQPLQFLFSVLSFPSKQRSVLWNYGIYMIVILMLSAAMLEENHCPKTAIT